jgi:hypothetical protein
MAAASAAQAPHPVCRPAITLCVRGPLWSSGEWTDTFGEERLTGALLDRLTHHVHILEMNGQSYRLAQSRSKRKR